MSYRSREKKRRARAAIASTKREFASVTATRYYLTPVKHDCRCSSCGGKLKAGKPMVYRQSGPVTLCVPCADKDPLVEYQPSVRWEKQTGAARALEANRARIEATTRGTPSGKRSGYRLKSNRRKAA